MSDTYVTLHGWVGSDIVLREAKGTPVANFRLASTPRLKRDGKWCDGETTWYSVTAWRLLAGNVSSSIRKGDAVIVHGRLRTDAWEREDGELNTRLQIDALLVGHDLTRGTSTFLRTPKPDRTSDADLAEAAAGPLREDPGQQGRVDGWGNPVPPDHPGPQEHPYGDEDPDDDHAETSGSSAA